MDLLTLIGDTQENFYQLGLNDKEKARAVHQDVKLMLRTPWSPVNKLIEEIGKNVIKNTLLKNSDKYQFLKPYAEGVGASLEECAYMMLIPEIVSCMSKWIPAVTKGNFGCSSFMSRNPNGSVIHGRILDFPLQGTYDLAERAISYQLNGMPKILGFGSGGIPYPSITLMTEHGMTLALHQKFTNVFNPQGTSIFEYIFKLVQVAHDKKSVIEFIKSNPTITTWCLYITFKDGDVLACDISGKEAIINEHQVPDKGILYFCNHLENKTLNQREFLPYGFDHYNLMREEVAGKKILSFLEKNSNPTEIELLKLMATPFKQNDQIENFDNFALDNLTCSSLSIMVMNPTENQAHYIGGPAPKTFKDEILLISNAFSDAQKTKVEIDQKEIVDESYHQGLQAMMKAQKAFDEKNSVQVYHQLQLAMVYLEAYPERHLVKFYFLMAQYMFESHEKTLATLLEEFNRFEGNLPEYLNDHCLMFIGRLEKILKLPPRIEEDKIQSLKLRDIYKKESKIPRPVFHLMTKNMIFPRIDILDVIYVITP